MKNFLIVLNWLFAYFAIWALGTALQPLVPDVGLSIAVGISIGYLVGTAALYNVRSIQRTKSKG